MSSAIKGYRTFPLFVSPQFCSRPLRAKIFLHISIVLSLAVATVPFLKMCNQIWSPYWADSLCVSPGNWVFSDISASNFASGPPREEPTFIYSALPTMRYPVEACSKSYMWCFGVLHIARLHKSLFSHLPRYLPDSAATSCAPSAPSDVSRATKYYHLVLQ